MSGRKIESGHEISTDAETAQVGRLDTGGHRMQLEAVYDDGKLEFRQPVRFAHRRFLVRVDVPEQEVIEATTVDVAETLSAYASHWLRRLESIRTEAMKTPEAQLPPVSDEQLDRLRAIEMREAS